MISMRCLFTESHIKKLRTAIVAVRTVLFMGFVAKCKTLSAFVFCHVFLKTQAFLHNLLCMVSADKSVMPGLKHDAGNVGFVFRITENETEAPAVFF